MICPSCGIECDKKTGRQERCLPCSIIEQSRKARERHKKKLEEAKKKKKTCIACDKDFETVYKRKYCSQECKEKLKLEKEKEIWCTKKKIWPRLSLYKTWFDDDELC